MKTSAEATAAEEKISTGVLNVPTTALSRPAEAAQNYLLVFEQQSSRLFPLSENGEVVIGRSESADLVLKDNLVSRHHASLQIEGGSVRVWDRGSQNGTFVNGEQISGSRLLLSGDTIAICTVTLIFHGSSKPRGKRPILPLDEFRERVEGELDRALRYQREVSVLVLFAREGFASPEALRALVAPQLRRIDVMGWVSDDQLAILLPESGAAGADIVGARLLRALGKHFSGLQAGFSTYPRDGADVDTLLSGARSAAFNAKTGELVPIRQSFKTLELGNDKVVVADPSMVRLYGLIERLATAELPVTIVGETGTGKELAASALHHWSSRFSKPLVSLNCAAFQESLVESELFGFERGAFSGAQQSKIGLLESANGGTVFLDEVGELSLTVQAKLLRVLETQRFTRLGETRERQINVRFVCATNRDLEREVKAGRFRQDLFFRLNAAKLHLPPLRDRRLEIPILAQSFLTRACERLGRPSMTIAPAALALLSGHHWPGNVRELRNLMDYLAATVQEPTVETWHVVDRLPEEDGGEPGGDELTPPNGTGLVPLEEEIRRLEQNRMWSALVATGGNKTKAAAMIGMPLRTFLTKLKKYGPPGER